MVVAANALRIVPAGRAQEPAIKALLARCALPHVDIAAHLQHFHVAMRGTELLGTVGIELYGSVALLRSLALAEEVRAQGLGRRLCERMESYARSHGVARLYLLTETAAGFFARLGYIEMPRQSAPEAIKQTSEFAHCCPASATCMMKELGAR